jgi:hypothetical protein
MSEDYPPNPKIVTYKIIRGPIKMIVSAFKYSILKHKGLFIAGELEVEVDGEYKFAS